MKTHADYHFFTNCRIQEKINTWTSKRKPYECWNPKIFKIKLNKTIVRLNFEEYSLSGYASAFRDNPDFSNFIQEMFALNIVQSFRTVCRCKKQLENTFKNS